MTMQGQGESQPGEGADPLSELTDAIFSVPEDEQERNADPESDEADGGEQEESADDAEEQEGEADEEPVKQKFTIKHDGKDVELELDPGEHVEMLQKAFDYTKKTMALAENTKTVEVDRAKAAEFRAQHEQAANETLSRLEAFRSFMESQVGEPPSVDIIHLEGAETYLARKELYEQRKGQLRQAEAAIEHTQAEKHRERQAYLQRTASESIAALQNTLSGWNEKTLPDLEAYVQQYGLNPQSAEAGYVQKGLWELAHKAKAYDAIQAQKAQMKPTAQLTKVAKPSAANQSGKATERAKREAEFYKSPSVDSLAQLFITRK